MTPARREFGDARQVWESDNAAVGETDTLLGARLSGEPAIGHACGGGCVTRQASSSRAYQGGGLAQGPKSGLVLAICLLALLST
jgi:hypothetical protein